MSSAMNPGHEDCDHELVEEKMLCQQGSRVTIICLHEHMEPVRAYDTLGSGPIVADLCLCCSAIIKREDYR